MFHELEDQVRELFLDENNWNNADITSGQYVESESEIYQRLVQEAKQ